MKISLDSLRQLVLEEVKNIKKASAISTKRQKRENRLVENALRLLKEAEDEEEASYDPGQGEGETQATAAGQTSLGFSSLEEIPPALMKTANDQLEGNDGQGDGGLFSKISQTKALAPTVEWLNTFLDEKQNPAGPEVAKAVHIILGSGTKDGNDDQKINADPSSQVPAGDLVPTQGEIDMFKSIGHPLCNPESFMDCFSGDPHGQNKSIVRAGEFVLDGHHRWSTIACILGPQAGVNAVNFNVPHINAEVGEQILAVSQVAITGDTEYGKLQQGQNMVPLATTSEVTDNEGKKIDTNILGNADKLTSLLALIKAGKNKLSDYDEHSKRYKNSEILGEAYLDYAVFGNQGEYDAVAGFTEAFKKQYSVAPPASENQSESEDGAPSSLKSSISECSEEEILKLRTDIVKGLMKNWGGCQIGDVSSKPPRNLMPQFDGGETHGQKYDTGKKDEKGKAIKKGIVDDKEVMAHMQAGETNFKPDFVDDKYLEESIDLARWNKLAGLLKD